MRKWFRPTRRQLALAHAGVVYRRFQCTGVHCTCEVIAMEGLEITCNTSGCRGSMKPRRKVPLAKVIDLEVERLKRRISDENHPVERPSSGVFRSQRRRNSTRTQRHHPENSEALDSEKPKKGNDADHSPSGDGEGAS